MRGAEGRQNSARVQRGRCRAKGVRMQAWRHRCSAEEHRARRCRGEGWTDAGCRDERCRGVGL